MLCQKSLADLYLLAIIHYAKKICCHPPSKQSGTADLSFLVIGINGFFVYDKFLSALVDIQVGAAEAERFSKAFHEVHRKLVCIII
jgi:hypothetical protein